MQKSKVLLVTGIIVAASAATYLALSRKPKPKPSDGPDARIDESGQEVSTEQQKIPSNLAEILKLKSDAVYNALKGKTIKTKLADVNVRLDPYVNNGFFDNIVGVISRTGTPVGAITGVVDDSQGAVNAQGKVYKWFRVDKPTSDAIKQLEDSSSFLKSYNKDRVIFLREDTITL